MYNWSFNSSFQHYTIWKILGDVFDYTPSYASADPRLSLICWCYTITTDSLSMESILSDRTVTLIYWFTYLEPIKRENDCSFPGLYEHCDRRRCETPKKKRSLGKKTAASRSPFWAWWRNTSGTANRDTLKYQACYQTLNRTTAHLWFQQLSV